MKTAVWCDPLTNEAWESELVPPVREENFHNTGFATRYQQPESDGWYYVRFAGPIGNPYQWFVARYQGKVVNEELLWSLYPWHIDGDENNLRFQRIDMVEWKPIKTARLAVPVLLKEVRK